jgi:hypothetical protein
MSYSAGVTLIMTKIQAGSSFDTTNTSDQNWLLLNSGKSNHYAILRPGAPVMEWISPTVYKAMWITVVELWQLYTDEINTKTALYALIAELLTSIMPHPRLGDTTGAILDSSVKGGKEPEQRWAASGGPTWLVWEVNIEWQEEVTVTIS